jgi:hypothetical protein
MPPAGASPPAPPGSTEARATHHHPHPPPPAEINHSPSFNIDSPLDRAVKEAVIGDTLALVAPPPRAAARAKRSQRSAAEARLLAGLRPQQRADQEPRAGGRPGARQDQERAAGREQQAGGLVLPGRASCTSTTSAASADEPCSDKESAAEQQQQDALQDSAAAGAAGAAASGKPGSPGSELPARRPPRMRQLGGFERVYPVHKQPELQALYDELLGLAEWLFKAGAAAGAPSTPRGAAAAAAPPQGRQPATSAGGPAAGTKEAQGSTSAASGAGLRAVRLLHNSFARPGSADRRTLLSTR